MSEAPAARVVDGRSAQRWPREVPDWWLVIAWAGIIAVTVAAAPYVWSKLASGLLMLVAFAALRLGLRGRPRLWPASVVVALVAGLVATVLAPAGVAEIAVVLAASRMPVAFTGRALTVLTVLATLAFAAAVGWVSKSAAGVLAGAAIPVLVQRATERRELVVERDRARALLAEVQAGREAEAQAAALRERGRIARDMHDVLAHSLAGLSLQLQATRAVAARSGAGPEIMQPLEKAADLARDGVAEARAAVSALRDPGGLGLDALPALVERHPGAARLTVCGEPATVRPEAGHAVYRAVQEALTNAARYSPGSPVDVELAWRPGELRARIDDAGPSPGRPPLTGQGSGLGLAGMQERVEQVGGTLRAGPRPDGGWRVEVVVPT